MNKPDNRVEYDIWFTSSNDRALDFISDFKEQDKKFSEKVLMTPHYVFWKCTQCEDEYLQNDCFGGGKYCAVEPSNEKIQGREIILEDLREICLYKKFYNDVYTRSKWWEYMSYVHTYCANIINEECSKKAHDRFGIDFKETERCVKSSFSSSNQNDWGNARTSNYFIDEEIEYWKTYGAGIYPSLVINNRTYRGQLESLAVKNALCAGFENPPAMCEATLGSYTPDFLPQDDGIRASVIVAIVVALVLVNVIIIYCYRRYSKREMQNEMQMQIESAVSQYFALSQRDGKAFVR